MLNCSHAENVYPRDSYFNCTLTRRSMLTKLILLFVFESGYSADVLSDVMEEDVHHFKKMSSLF